MSDSERSVDFKTSKLGTKEYWDNFYKLEHDNFVENPEDIGECWFDESNAEEKMVDYFFDNLTQHFPNPHVCDLGSGNGHLLFHLYEEGLRGELIGVDYSETSLEFASHIAKNKDYNVRFERSDILDSKDSFLRSNIEKFDIILDKGTLDAIALSDTLYEGNLTGHQIYPMRIVELLKQNGVLLITSCNFTEEELTHHFTKDHLFKEFGKVDYPKLEFGGRKGSTICTMAFQKL